MTVIRADQCVDVVVSIRPEDVIETVFKASGPGGQARNKTSSSLRLVHVPTGLIVTATESRSQWVNRQTAWERLRSQLAERDAAVQTQAASAARAAQFGQERQWLWCAWRDRITSPSGRTTSMKAALRGGLGRHI